MSLALQDVAVTVVALVAAALIVVRFARAWRPSGARSACASCNCAAVSRRSSTTGAVATAPGGAAGAATVVPLRLIRNTTASHQAAER